MQPLSVHPNCYKKNLRFFSSYNKEKSQAYQQKKEKQCLTNHWIIQYLFQAGEILNQQTLFFLI